PDRAARHLRGVAQQLQDPRRQRVPPAEGDDLRHLIAAYRKGPARCGGPLPLGKGYACPQTSTSPPNRLCCSLAGNSTWFTRGAPECAPGTRCWRETRTCSARWASTTTSSRPPSRRPSSRP